MAHEEKWDHKFKVVLLGDSCVGKTSLIQRFVQGTFRASGYMTTIGTDFMDTIVEVDGARVRLDIWDTAGQERFRGPIVKSVYRKADGIMVVYDVNNRQSYDHVIGWLAEIDETALPYVCKMLIGNKSESLLFQRSVDFDQGQQLASVVRIPFYETSSQNNANVSEAFIELARAMISSAEQRKLPKQSIVELKSTMPQHQPRKSGCLGVPKKLKRRGSGKAIIFTQ